MNLNLTEKSVVKVLIVDDNEHARLMIKRYLCDRTDQFYEREDGAEVVSTYSDYLPDWVLMDWEMKQVNGLTATRDLLAHFPDAKILMVTNYDERFLHEAAIEAGAIDFILKDDLRQILKFLPVV